MTLKGIFHPDLEPNALFAPELAAKGSGLFAEDLIDSIDPLVSCNDLPVPARLRQRGSSELYQNLLLTTLAVAAVTTVFREPLYTQYPATKARTDWTAPNLLTSTLAPSQAPFAQTDWSAPARERARGDDAPPNLLTSTLAAPQAAPFFQADWSTPARERTRTEDTAPNLLASTLSIAPPTTVHRQPIYSTRQAVRLQPQWLAPNLVTSTLFAAPQVTPFSVTDWSMPKRPVRRQPDTQPNLLQNTLFTPPPPGSPFIQADWVRGPAVPKRTRAEQLPSLLQTTLFVAPAATQILREPLYTPRQDPRKRSLEQYQNLLETTLAAAPTTTVFRATGWQQREATLGRTDWLAPNLQTGTLAGFVAAAPFKPYDWPRPTAVHSRASEFLPAPFALLNAPSSTPFANYDWQRPKRLMRWEPEVLQRNLVLLTPPPTFQAAWAQNANAIILGPGTTQ